MSTMELEKIVACSLCFKDEGLQVEAEKLGEKLPIICPSCKQKTGKKLDLPRLNTLAFLFFEWGSFVRAEYGGASRIKYNDRREKSDESLEKIFGKDLVVFENNLGISFFEYGPRYWMVGGITPLRNLIKVESRDQAIDRIIEEYPTKVFKKGHKFYRLRIDPKFPFEKKQYDSPPKYLDRTDYGRLDSPDMSVLYGSEIISACLHECRVSVEDSLYLATMTCAEELRLLDLTKLLIEPDETEFESLDLAVHMLFLAGAHSYEICRTVAEAAFEKGFDGLLYPSFFGLLETGAFPYPSTLGISHRRIPQYQQMEEEIVVPNIAIFGSPVADGRINVGNINSLQLAKVEYQYVAGPLDTRPPWNRDPC